MYNCNNLYGPLDSITLIGVFICKLRQKSVHSNNNYLNEPTLSKSSIAKQSFKSTLPLTSQPSKMDDNIKLDTLPPTET